MLNRPPVKIALVGRAKTGKTFVAEYLRTKHHFKRKSLGDPVNRMLKIMYFYDRNQRVAWETKRALYDAIYKIDKNLLIGYLEKRLELSNIDVVVDDVRYTDEALRLKDLGFLIVRITAPKPKELHVTKALGKTAEPGTLLLNEMYNKDFTRDLGVDYSIYNETRDGTKQKIDILLARYIDK